MTALEHLYTLSVVLLSGIVLAIAVVKIAMYKEEDETQAGGLAFRFCFRVLSP